MKKLLAILIVILGSVFCYKWYSSINEHDLKYAYLTRTKLSNNQHGKAVWITVWVHGTKLPTAYIFKKFFFVPAGLHPAIDLDLTYHHRAIAQTLAAQDNSNFPLEHFYLFGWSGELSHTARLDAAETLFKDLKKLLTHYKLLGLKPKLRIITHSHGGNVVLNMVPLLQKDHLTLDELILLACPVQDLTKTYITCPCFKHIYALYSESDLIQVADPQGLYPHYNHKEGIFERDWFSQRTFTPQHNLKQASINYDGRGLLHVEFLLIDQLSGFIPQLPNVLSIMQQSTQPLFTIDLYLLQKLHTYS